MAHLTHLHALLSQVDEFTATKNIEIALELLIEFMNYLCVEVEAILKELESAPNNSAPEVKKEPVGELLDANKDVKQESLKKTSTDDIIQPIPINAYDRMISPNTFWDRVNDTWIRVLQAGNKLSPRYVRFNKVTGQLLGMR